MAHREGKDSGVIQPITGKRKVASKGEALDNEDVIACIESSGFRIRYNEVAAELEVNGESMVDAHYANIVTAVRLIGESEESEILKRERTVQLALDAAKVSKKYDPLNDYLWEAHAKYHARGLHPDTPKDWSPIRQLRNAIVAKREESAGDEGVDWPYECLKYWLCGAIAKIRNGSQGWMLVLQGKQGVGKSLLSRKLGRAAGGQYFNAGIIDPRNKDHIIKRSSTFVWEAEELDGTMNSSDMALLKAFLTQDTAKERMPYARFATQFTNRCSFIGTVNTSNFLKDTTGNRRFLCMEILDMDRDMILALDSDMIWGEASYMLENELRLSDNFLLLPDYMKEAQCRVNELVRSTSALEVALDARIMRGNGNTSKEQLRALVADLGFPAGVFPLVLQYMVDHGYEQKHSVKVNGKVTPGFKGCQISLP